MVPDLFEVHLFFDHHFIDFLEPALLSALSLIARIEPYLQSDLPIGVLGGALNASLELLHQRGCDALVATQMA